MAQLIIIVCPVHVTCYWVSPPLYKPLGQLLLIIIIVSFKFVEMIKSRQRVSAPQAVEELPEEAPEEEERERERRHLTSVKTERNQKEN